MEIKVLHQVMEWNEDVSAQVREVLAANHVCMINIMGSPGAGKTSLITALIERLRRDRATSPDRSTPKKSPRSRSPPSSSTRTARATSRP